MLTSETEVNIQHVKIDAGLTVVMKMNYFIEEVVVCFLHESLSGIMNSKHTT
jgi:hypothetical protein